MSKKLDLPLSSFGDLFFIEEQQDAKLERVQEIPVVELNPFQNHPFKVLQDEKMDRLCQSMKEYGVLSPLMARPVEGGYEIVSDHPGARWRRSAEDGKAARSGTGQPMMRR
ncbi:MAG TPA: ParB N-terminal domain-containing protein [Firmicutes bacterium]|nr:ParB N-terminal domain-containing protein [Bacillota bacterium]